MQVAEPEDACTPVQVPVVGRPWVALVVRSQEKLKNCTFDVKARSSQHARAVPASMRQPRAGRAGAGREAGKMSGLVC